uniref:adenine phosphoribosyltransferase n=1 Tax=Neolamprologus brichardi TaxID=32507 RepID=A0A3Q4N1N9_NEOBR
VSGCSSCLVLMLHCLSIRVFVFPQENISNICPILKDPAALKAVIDLFEEHVRNNHQHVDLIVGKKNKSRALKLLLHPLYPVVLITNMCTAARCHISVVQPSVSVSVTLFALFLQAEAEIQEDAVAPGQRVLLVDDLLATGGTLYAASELMRKQQAEVLGCMVVIELKELNGVDKLKLHRVFSLLQY